MSGPPPLPNVSRLGAQQSEVEKMFLEIQKSIFGRKAEDMVAGMAPSDNREDLGDVGKFGKVVASNLDNATLLRIKQEISNQVSRGRWAKVAPYMPMTAAALLMLFKDETTSLSPSVDLMPSGDSPKNDTPETQLFIKEEETSSESSSGRVARWLSESDPHDGESSYDDF